MVLEQIFRTRWLEQRPLYAFILGLCYSLVGIISAKLIFPTSTSLMAVAFTSILLIPSLNRLLSDEENVEIRENKFSIKMLFKDHKDIFEIYFYMFMGVFLTFGIIAVLLPNTTAVNVFSSQLKVAGITGQATGGFTITSIFMNNLLIFGVCFILSLVYGAGSVIFLTWNASVWGAVFGYVARESAGGGIGNNPIASFFILILPVMPHLVGEAVSYLSASIVGGVVSKAVLREKLFSEKFHHVLTDALLFLALGIILVIIAAIVEVKLYPIIRF